MYGTEIRSVTPDVPDNVSEAGSTHGLPENKYIRERKVSSNNCNWSQLLIIDRMYKRSTLPELPICSTCPFWTSSVVATVKKRGELNRVLTSCAV